MFDSKWGMLPNETYEKPEQTIKFGAPYFTANPEWFWMVSAEAQSAEAQGAPAL